MVLIEANKIKNTEGQKLLISKKHSSTQKKAKDR